VALISSDRLPRRDHSGSCASLQAGSGVGTEALLQSLEDCGGCPRHNKQDVPGLP
jgi:hypothetical protein